jgi:hypothetical protein
MWLNLDVLVDRWLGRRRALLLARGAGVCGVVAVGLCAGRQAGCRTDEVPLGGVRVLDVESGERFSIELRSDFTGWPVRCPGSGKSNGYPAEICRSSACAARGGTWVVLNSQLGRSGPTRCPACRTIVRPRHAEGPEDEEE